MDEPRRRNIRAALTAAAAVVTAVAVGACSSPQARTEPDVVVIETVFETVPSVPAALGSGAAASPGVGGGFDGFDAFAAQLPARVGLAIVPVGGGQAVTAGTLPADLAWSTIKVPLALAALAADPAQAGNAAAAITVSDNAAAQAMWDSLGAGTSAAAAVQQVLARFGDPSTVVQPEVTRPGYTAFGQTLWPLTAQAQFAAALPCHPDAEQVLALMGQVSAEQSWGLGTLPGARFKGGWGPDPTGGYLVRQFGIVDTGTGQIAVAVAAAPTTGAFDDAIAVLDRVASWLAPRLAATTLDNPC
ncbi:hypothetical protein [Rhodococcus zopfii]|uniref:hypothetical protein n=1 Tax=Rhodococcus zopfii TaxID=43772 RepID=UPI0009337970|nr:hypothetical protein [Rhodococcus zopfii]